MASLIKSIPQYWVKVFQTAVAIMEQQRKAGSKVDPDQAVALAQTEVQREHDEKTRPQLQLL